MTLDLSADVVALTRRLIDIESVSRNEQAIADAVEEALRALPHLSVERIGNTLVARTDLGRSERVVISGHLDTVPVNDNLPSRLEGDLDRGLLWGLGSCDMKGGDAVILIAHHYVPPHLPMRAMSDDLRHIPVVFDTAAVTVGPLVEPGRTACLSCLAQRERERDDAWPAIVAQLVARKPDAVPRVRAMEAGALVARMLHERLALPERGADRRTADVSATLPTSKRTATRAATTSKRSRHAARDSRGGDSRGSTVTAAVQPGGRPRRKASPSRPALSR